MKKLLVAVASLAALVLASCSTPVAKANDQLDTPDVKVEALDNGVVLLKFEEVPGASYYTVAVKEPGAEDFVNISNQVEVWKGRTVTYAVPVYEKDAEYTYKVYARCASDVTVNRPNLIDSDACEVSVTTPEEWKETEIDVSSIQLAKVANTSNQYNVLMNVNAGYKYDVKVVNNNGSTPKSLFNVSNKSDFNAVNVLWNKTSNTVTNQATFNGINYVKVVKENEEGEEVVQASCVTGVNLPAGPEASNDPYYVIVKATPVNTEANTVKYAISTASASYNWSAADVSVTNNSAAATLVAPSKARVTFKAPKVDGKDVDASRFSVYYTLTQNVAAKGQAAKNETGDFVLVGKPTAKVMAGDNDKTVTYTIDADLAAYDTLKAYSYAFYIVAENEAADTWYTAGTVSPSGKDAYYDSTNTLTPINVVQTTGANVKVSYTASAGSTVKAYVQEFASYEAAANATAAEITNAVNIPSKALDTVTSVNTAVTTINGVQTTASVRYNNTNYTNQTVDYEISPVALTAGVMATKVTTIANTSTPSNTSVAKDVKTNGKYYVIRVVASKADCDDVVKKEVVYIQQETTSTVVNGVATTPTVTYSLKKTAPDADSIAAAL